MSMLMPELVGKQLQLLKEAIPGMSRVAVLSNPTVPTNELLLKEAEAAARLMNVQLQVLDVRAPGDFDSAFSAMIKNRSHALIVLGSSIFFADRARIVALASENRLPSMYLLKQYVEAGGFMSYGASNRESMRRAATYVDKVLKGAKPGDLPIEQATKLELNINLKTAKALGLTIPQGLLQRADEVIQ
jgi:putative ABC transport system substrate-binding protein